MKTPIEKLNEFKRIKRALEIYKSKAEHNRSLELDMRDEELELIYDKPLQNASKNIEYYSNQIKELNKKVIRYSGFSYKIIVNVLNKLIRVYEGKNFVMYDVRYNPNSIAKKARILINYERTSYIDNGYCDKDKLYSIQKNGDGIILDWDASGKLYIKFYTLTKQGDLKYNIKLNKFPYIKKFIDYVITHHIVNNIDGDLDEEELIELMETFIIENVDEILEHHKNIETNEEEKMKKQIEENSEYRAKQLSKVIDKYNGGYYEI